MAAFLQSHPDINVLFAHNDDMAIGAIQSIEAAGKKPGKDIKIVSIDGVKDGFVAMSKGQINAIVECNPLLGPQLMDTVKTVQAGKTVEPLDQDQGERLHGGPGRGGAARPQVLTAGSARVRSHGGRTRPPAEEHAMTRSAAMAEPRPSWR